MYISNDYYMAKLHNEHYLLPLGQELANHSHPLKINETGAFLWEQMTGMAKPGMEATDLSHRLTLLLMEQCGLDDSCRENVSSDVNIFLKSLIDNGILREGKGLCQAPDEALTFSFGKIMVSYDGPAELLHSSLLDFKANACECHSNEKMAQRWSIQPAPPLLCDSGSMILCHPLMNVIDNGDTYTLIYPANRHLRLCRLAKDGSHAWFYHDLDTCAEGRDELFHGLRNALLYVGAMHGLRAIHSASVLWDGRAVLFSAPSGTGKSTHADIWHRLFGAPYLNGDINLVGFENGRPMVYGIPWCGTSGLYTTSSYPLGGIVLLRQSASNSITELAADEKQLSVAQRIISHSWTRGMVEESLAFADRLIDAVPVFRLNCNIEDEAAIMARKKLGQ